MDAKTLNQVRSSKDSLLDGLRKTLATVGLGEHFEVNSIGLHLKHVPSKCPPGEEPVWEAVIKPDGTVVFEWVCK